MTPERLHELLGAFLDGGLDPAAERELAQALETDPEARRAFVRATDQHQSLGDLLGQPSAVRSRRNPWTAIGVAAAAAAILGLSAYLLFPRIPAPQAPGILVKEPHPIPSPPPVRPPPAPEPAPASRPEPPPLPKARPGPPSPPEPEKVPVPSPREPRPPAPQIELPPVRPPAPEPPQRPQTAIAAATLVSTHGDVFALAGGERKPAATGQVIPAGQGLETGAGDSSAVLVFADSTRIELWPGSTLSEISSASGKRVVVAQGALFAEVAKQPSGQPMTFVTRQAEAKVLGTKLALKCGDTTKLELKEGKARFTRTEDQRSVDVGAGQSSIAGKGQDLAPRRITRGPMMASAIWGEDFQEPEEIDRDWSLQREGISVSTRRMLDFDLSLGGTASLTTRATYSSALRISVDFEFTQRLRDTLAGLRLQSWKQGKEFIHLDIDEDRYYLTTGEQTVTADVAHKNPRRERWTLEIGSDGWVKFLADQRTVLKARRATTNAAHEDYHVILMTKSGKETPAGAHVRFDNLVLERMK